MVQAKPSKRSGRNVLRSEAILAAALRAFYSVGYGGTSVREIASAAGVTPAALYHHFPSKHEILTTLMERAMEADLAAIQRARNTSPAEPVDQLRAVVAAHVRFHTVHMVEAFIGNSELRSLNSEARRRVVALRDKHEELFIEVIAAGIQSGAFSVTDPEQAARAVLAMCTGIASWYRPDGAVAADTLVQLYVELSLNTVGYHQGHRRGVDKRSLSARRR